MSTPNLSKWFMRGVFVSLASTAVACGGDDTTTEPSADAGVSGTDGGTSSDAGVTGECGLAANVTRADALRAGQPTIGVQSKTKLTETVTFASEAGDPSVTCEVTLEFRDANGNGTLDPYEDWRLTTAERTTDVLAKMSDADKAGLLLHPYLSETPASGTTVDSTLSGWVSSGVRFGVSTDREAALVPRATWANALQALAEEQALGIPFLLSSEAAHQSGHGRTHARSFTEIPYELGLAAGGDATSVQTAGQLVAEEYAAVGIRMALDVPADLFTDPRWYQGQFTFGEDSTSVASMVDGYAQGFASQKVAAALGHYPGAGAAKEGVDTRLSTNKFLAYPGNAADAHFSAFSTAITSGAQAVVLDYGIPEAGSWSALSGAVSGASIEQKGIAFNEAIVTDGLRTAQGFTGLVLAPPGVLEDASGSTFGAPWGMESATREDRLVEAVSAGVDQFLGLSDVALVTGAVTSGLITTAQLDAAATRALSVLFDLGLFDNPYVDASMAAGVPSMNLTDGRRALFDGMVLLVNEDKPAGFLNGTGDGTQTGDKGNAGNGSGKVLPAPPGIAYVTAGCSFYIAGDFDETYVRDVAAGYGTLTNGASSVNGTAVTTDAERMALSDYVLIRFTGPDTVDPASGELMIPTSTLSYPTGSSSPLAPLAAARAAIDGYSGSGTAQAQIVVGIDAGRLPIMDQIMSYQPSAVFAEWMGINPGNADSDKAFLDVAFGIESAVGKLPVGAPASAAAVASQNGDVAGDGQSSTYVRGFGLTTEKF